MSNQPFYEDDAAEKKDKGRDLELFAIRTIMKIENGRSFMWRMLQHCQVFENIYHGDPLKHANNAGRRVAGLWLENELKQASPEYYLQMIKENM